MLRPLCLAAASGLFLPGCLIVVDHQSDTHWVHDDDAHHGRLGIYLEAPGSTLVSQLGIDRDRSGVITQVETGSPADKAGLRQYDVITAVDGDAAASVPRIRQAIRSHKSGEEVSFAILRQGKPSTITVHVP